MIQSLIDKLPAAAAVKPRALLRDYTTFKLGGMCRMLIECADAMTLIETLRVLHAQEAEFMVIGQGSNLLVSDRGIDLVVVRFCMDEVQPFRFEGSDVVVPANMLLGDVARLAIESGLGDVTFCSGIPGTLGGAIVGNAGAFGKQIGDVVKSVLVIDQAGREREIDATDLGFLYRSSYLKQSGDVVLEATLNLEKMDQAPMEKERKEIMALRQSKHPDWRKTPCAGSVFRNIEPTSAAGRRQAAGWFLEQAGVKSYRIGGAHLFDKHANIIVADDNASAQDVYELSEKMMEAVCRRFGFNLQREIKLVGDF